MGKSLQIKFRCSKESIMLQNTLTAIRTLLFLTIITGVIYPLIVTGFSERLFPSQANGSLIEKDGKVEFVRNTAYKVVAEVK